MGNRRLQDLVLFSFLPSSTKDRFISNMSNLPVIERLKVHEDQIAEQMGIIRKRYKHPSKSHIIKLFELGILCPICDNGLGFALPTFLPAWLISDSIVGVKSVVNLSLYGKITDTTSREYGGAVNIDVKNLYGLLQNGLILYMLYRYENRIMNNSDIVTNAMQCYVRMVLRCLDRLYGLNANKIESDKAAYVIALFFLVNIIGRKADTESVKSLAYRCCHNGTARNIVESTLENYEPSYDNIGSLFVTLANTVEGASQVTLRSCLETWTRLYGDSTILGLENFAQFAQILASTYVSAQLCNEVMVQNVTADYIKKFNVSFFQIQV